VTIDVRRGDFPALVMSFPRGRFWLREHVEAYAAGRRWTQEANERLRDSLRPQYLTGPETEKLTGLSRSQLNVNRDDAPPPAVQLGRRTLWLRAEVEASPAARRRASRLDAQPTSGTRARPANAK
jgi:predicted DNA-binding transcriptional regulator AlpA